MIVCCNRSCARDKYVHITADIEIGEDEEDFELGHTVFLRIVPMNKSNNFALN